MFIQLISISERGPVQRGFNNLCQPCIRGLLYCILIHTYLHISTLINNFDQWSGQSVYGNDLRGTNEAAHVAVDKIFHFARCILCVDPVASSVNGFGEISRMSLPQAFVHDISISIYKQTVSHVFRQKNVQNVFTELNRLHEQGFTTWMTKTLYLYSADNLYIK